MKMLRVCCRISEFSLFVQAQASAGDPSVPVSGPEQGELYSQKRLCVLPRQHLEAPAAHPGAELPRRRVIPQPVSLPRPSERGRSAQPVPFPRPRPDTRTPVPLPPAPSGRTRGLESPPVKGIHHLHHFLNRLVSSCDP